MNSTYKAMMKRFCLYFSKIKNETDGSVMVVAAISMAVLIAMMAFALDLGAEYVETSRLQNALDSASLAAARELPADNTTGTTWYNAVNQAIKFAGANGINDTGSLNIDPVYENDTARIIGVTISMTEEVHYNFAEIFGVSGGSVTRSATAQLKNVNKMTGLVPLCITQESMSQIGTGVTTTLKFSSNQSDGSNFYNTSGWFGVIQLDGSGSPYYEDDFIYGCTSLISVGDVLSMQTGNMSGPTGKAFFTRISGHSGCTYQSHEADCPRFVTVPVVTILPDKQVQVEGFAQFFLVDLGGNGNDSYIQAVYTGDTVLPGTISSGNAGDFGLYVARLVS